MKQFLKLGIMLALFAFVSSAWATFTAVGNPNGSRSWSQQFQENGVGNFDRVEVLWISGSYFVTPGGQSGFNVAGWSETTTNQYMSIAMGPATTTDVTWFINFENSSAEPLTFLFRARLGSTLLDQALATWNGSGWTFAAGPTCDATNPVIVDISNGIPSYECLFICPDQPTVIVVGPGLGPNQQPVVTVTSGCQTGGCDDPNCPPAIPVVGSWSYDPSTETWINTVIAAAGTPPGCVCLCLDRILPVELTSFDAISGDASVTLNWVTGSETNNDHFDIVRDEAIVGRVEADNSASGSQYSWTEANLTNGRVYNYTLLSVDISGVTEELSTASVTPSMNAATITEYALHQNYPNPFNPATMIAFDLVDEGSVMLAVYNPLGQKITTLIDGEMAAGRHTVNFNAASLPSGLYFYRMEAGEFNTVRKMILMK